MYRDIALFGVLIGLFEDFIYVKKKKRKEKISAK